MATDDFFKPTSRLPAPPPRPPVPPWLRGPDNVIGRSVPIQTLVARTDNVAVAVQDVVVYPDAFEFSLTIRLRVPGDPRQEMHTFGMMLARGDPKGEVPPEVLRLGVVFSDGSKATNTEGLNRFGPDMFTAPPPAAVLTPSGGGGGGGRRYDMRYRVWPLPPDGPLTFVCEWPAREVPVTGVEVDAGAIRSAAAEAIVLWPDDVTSWDGRLTLG